MDVVKPGPRTLNNALLNVRLSELVAPHLREGLREITDIYVAPESRRQGRATRLLASVCSEADGSGMTLLLAAVGSEEASTDDLCGWYRRHGFAYLQLEPVVLMARLPAIAQGRFHG